MNPKQPVDFGCPCDHYESPGILDRIGSCGAKNLEPATIEEIERITEEEFNEAYAKQYSSWLKHGGLACFAFSSHMDLGISQGDRILGRQINAASKHNSRSFSHTFFHWLRLALRMTGIDTKDECNGGIFVACELSGFVHTFGKLLPGKNCFDGNESMATLPLAAISTPPTEIFLFALPVHLADSQFY